MKRVKRAIIVAIAILTSSHGFSQVSFEPNYTLKSPETISLISLENRENSTVINMSITNLVEGGYFCADKNTYLTTDKGVRYKLINAIGIPYCPEVNRFSQIGERLYFTLVFPLIDRETAWFDIVEECGDNCFSILGVTTDEKLNERVNSCFDIFESGELREAAEMFEALLPELESSRHALTGSVYMNLIIIYKSLGDKKEAYYMDRLLKSDMPHRDRIIEGLKRI